MKVAGTVIDQQGENSLLVAVDCHQTELLEEMVQFFKDYAGRQKTPFASWPWWAFPAFSAPGTAGPKGSPGPKTPASSPTTKTPRIG
jgi:hypothetical protein